MAERTIEIPEIKLDRMTVTNELDQDTRDKLQACVDRGLSIRKAAEMCGVAKNTAMRFMLEKRAESQPEIEDDFPERVSYRYRAERDAAAFSGGDRMGRYRARPTYKVANVGMNYLSDLIIRPGIQKYFRPLLLYRGAMSYGHAHRLWNMVVLMMAAECETLADGIKVLNNPEFAQLCGPLRHPGKPTMMSFFGRLWNSPDVTRVLPGMTEYVKFMGLGPCWLTPVELESDKQFVAPWRISNHPDFDPQAEKPEYGIRNLFYPYIAHDPKKKNDGHKIVMMVNEMIPRFIPENIRADACQEMVVGLLSGEIPAGKAHDWANEYVRKIYRLHPNMGKSNFMNAQQERSLDHHFVSMDGENIPYTERM